jgi:hypothetical protein
MFASILPYSGAGLMFVWICPVGVIVGACCGNQFLVECHRLALWTKCREQGPQGREVYQTYASALFILIALWEVSFWAALRELSYAA